jgi:hypothetical protein
MRARWADGRAVVWAGSEPHLVGTPEVVAEALLWLARQPRGVAVSPTGPFVSSAVSDRLAVFAAVCAVAPGAVWEGAPELLAGVPDGAVC